MQKKLQIAKEAKKAANELHKYKLNKNREKYEEIEKRVKSLGKDDKKANRLLQKKDERRSEAVKNLALYQIEQLMVKRENNALKKNEQM